MCMHCVRSVRLCHVYALCPQCPTLQCVCIVSAVSDCNVYALCPQYDGAVSDFPEQAPGSSASASGTVGTRWAGFSSYSDWKWHVLNKPNMDMLRNHKGTYRAASSGEYRQTQRSAIQCSVARPSRHGTLVIHSYLLILVLRLKRPPPTAPRAS
jgi:hypothetical protein